MDGMGIWRRGHSDRVVPTPYTHHTTRHKQANRDKEPRASPDLTIDLDSTVTAPSLLPGATKVTLASCTLFLCVAALVVLGTILTVCTKVHFQTSQCQRTRALLNHPPTNL